MQLEPQNLHVSQDLYGLNPGVRAGEGVHREGEGVVRRHRLGFGPPERGNPVRPDVYQYM